MQNDNFKDAIRDLGRKLDAFKSKIRYQQLLAQSLGVEFESLTFEFESLKQKLGASSENFESTSSKFDATLDNFESLPEKIGALSWKDESSAENFDALSSDFESTSTKFESLSKKIGASSSKLESTSSNFESTSENYGATSEQIEASSSLQEVTSLIWRLAKEKKIYFGQSNIPNRLARIVLAFGERKELSVLEMRRITGASRNTLVRDIKILKELGWLEFHGSRKNGYFTLTDSGSDMLIRKVGG
jgi:chromosome segregation ATPase